MKRMTIRLAAALALAVSAAEAGQTRELLVCGWNEVYILDLARPAGEQKVFSWKAAARPELSAYFRGQFRFTDDAKAVAGGRILITSSSGDVALVERATGKTLFWAHAPNAHSAELLPGERIAVACSTHKTERGDRLILFDANTPEKEIASTELRSAHGVVWDPQRRVLWALGYDSLRMYSLADWATPSPSLRETARWPLPSPGGHELSPGDAGSQTLVVSALAGTWLFDRDRKQFTPHPLFARMEHLKSASLHPVTGQWAYTLADLPDWWTSKIRFNGPDAVIERPGERLYKVRWVAR